MSTIHELATDPTHYPIQDTLRGIRRRAGYTVHSLALHLKVTDIRIEEFEAQHAIDQEILDAYGKLARQQRR